MRLMRLCAHFGILDGAEVSFEPGRLQLVVGDNERGKSTLVAAIVAALYGLAPGNRGARPESSRFQPLDGACFDVELDLEAGGRRLRLRREFIRGICTVADLDRGQDVTAEFATGKGAWEIGRVLLGLSREQFLRSALVRQGEIGALALDRDAAALTTRIQQLVGSSAGDATADAAIQTLGEALRGYQGSMHKGPVSIGNEIHALEERIAALQLRLTDLQHERSSLDGAARRLAGLSAEAERLRGERSRAVRAALRAEAEDAAARLARDNARRARRDALAERRASLQSLPVATADLAERLAAMDGAIAGHDRAVREAEEAIAAATTRLQQAGAALAGREHLAEAMPDAAAQVLRAAERLERVLAAAEAAAAAVQAAQAPLGPDDTELERRFGALAAADLDALARHTERRTALQSALDAAVRLQADAQDHARHAALLRERAALDAVPDADPARGNALAALDATIRGREESLAEAEAGLAEAIARRQEIAVRAASRAHLEAATTESVQDVLRAQDRLQQAERAEQAAILARSAAESQAGPTDRELQRRFGERRREELEELARYPQRREDLRGLLEEKEAPRPAPQPRRRRPLWLGLGVLLAVAGAVLATMQPIAGAPLIAAGLALAAFGWVRRPAAPLAPDTPFLRDEAQRRLKALDDRMYVLATSLGYRSPGEAIGALQAWEDARDRLEQRFPRRRIEEMREHLADERREAGRALARWGWSAGRTGATPEMLASLHQEMAAHLADREALERYTRAEETVRRRVEQVRGQRDADLAAFAAQAAAPAASAAERAAAIEAARTGLRQRERREAVAGRLAELSARLLPAAERERLAAAVAAGEAALTAISEQDGARAEATVARDGAPPAEGVCRRMEAALSMQDEQAAVLAARAGFADPAAAAAGLRTWMQARPALLALAGAEARLIDAGAAAAAIREEAARLIARWDEAIAPAAATPAQLVALHAQMSQAAQQVAELTSARSGSDAASARLVATRRARGCGECVCRSGRDARRNGCSARGGAGIDAPGAGKRRGAAAGRDARGGGRGGVALGRGSHTAAGGD